MIDLRLKCSFSVTLLYIKKAGGSGHIHNTEHEQNLFKAKRWSYVCVCVGGGGGAQDLRRIYAYSYTLSEVSD